MRFTLYLPEQEPQRVFPAKPYSADLLTGVVAENGPVTKLLGCPASLVDVLANGPTYVVFTIFDHEGKANPEAMRAVSNLTGMRFSIDEADEVLSGPVLVVQQA